MVFVRRGKQGSVIRKTLPMKKKVQSIERRVKLLEGSEDKGRSDTIVNGSVDYAGTLTELTAIQQGDQYTQRTGDDIMVNFIQFRCGLIAGDTTNFVRHMIVRWLDDATPTVLNILQNASSTYAPLSAINYEGGRMKFQILYDRLYAVDTDAEVTKKYITVNKKVFYDGATSSAGVKGRLYSLWISDSSTATHPNVKCYYRLGYVM